MNDEHMISIILNDGSILWVKCESPMYYMRMMEQEFKLDKIRKNNPRIWHSLIWQINPKSPYRYYHGKWNKTAKRQAE